ncbi:hypothetical protein K438DRAFT_2009890 [Mycena galopus ATCC 62051]|nr:hypothetical protein K438DRAFT_2009890 [Mycena galopus ATCC 62051]
MVAPAAPDLEATQSPIVVKVVHTIDLETRNLNMSDTLTKERSTEFLVYNADPVDQGELDSSSSDEMSIHVESPVDQSLSSSALTAVSTQPETDDATVTDDFSAPLRRSRVHFRSRVRITSGLHHAASSLSSSPSSSISAPLRAPLTEADCTPGWGTLGQRVGLFAVSNRQAAEARMAKHRARRRANEHSALLGDPRPPGYDGYNRDSDAESGSDDECSDIDGEALLSRQIDLVFGRWPGRLLNHHWWWWQLQPLICCGCLDEPD